MVVGISTRLFQWRRDDRRNAEQAETNVELETPEASQSPHLYPPVGAYFRGGFFSQGHTSRTGTLPPLRALLASNEEPPMSSLFTTALLSSAIIVGSALDTALAQDSMPGIEACEGELCPPKAPRQDMPDQKMMGANQGEQMKGQDQASGQAIPRKKKRVSNQQIYAAKSYRIGCGEGRAIVAKRFNQVRMVECNGATYTYLGRRQGDTYRVLLNARTGRIVGRILSREQCSDGWLSRMFSPAQCL
jgi:hypothetical protein